MLQLKEEGGMILICIPLQLKADIREVYPLQSSAPSEDRFFTDWSSEGSRSPHEEPPKQNIPVREDLLAHGMGDAYEVE